MAEDFAVAESDLALCKSGHFWVVRHHDDGVAVAVQVFEQLGDDLLIGCVEVAGWFVSEQDRRIIDEGAGDADALLFAAGEFAGQVVGAMAEANFFECATGFGFVGHGVEVLREHDVFDGGEIRDEVKLLEDEADLVGAEAVELGGRHLGYVHVVDLQLARSWAVEAADEIDESALAGT